MSLKNQKCAHQFSFGCEKVISWSVIQMMLANFRKQTTVYCKWFCASCMRVLTWGSMHICGSEIKHIFVTDVCP